MNPKVVIYSSKCQCISQIAKKLARQKNLPCIDIKDILGFSFQKVTVLFCTSVKKRKTSESTFGLKAVLMH